MIDWVNWYWEWTAKMYFLKILYRSFDWHSCENVIECFYLQKDVFYECIFILSLFRDWIPHFMKWNLLIWFLQGNCAVLFIKEKAAGVCFCAWREQAGISEQQSASYRFGSFEIFMPWAWKYLAGQWHVNSNHNIRLTENVFERGWGIRL